MQDDFITVSENDNAPDYRFEEESLQKNKAVLLESLVQFICLVEISSS